MQKICTSNSNTYFYSNQLPMESKKIQEIRKKPKEFTPPESFHIGEEISLLKKSALDFIDVIHRMTTMQHMKIAEARGAYAVRMVTRAVRVILAYKDGGSKRELTPSQKRKVIDLAEDVLNGRKTMVQFQALPDGNGICEMVSNEIMQVQEDQILQPSTYKTQGNYDRF